MKIGLPILLCLTLMPTMAIAGEHLLPLEKPLFRISFPETWLITEDNEEDENWIEAIREEDLEVEGKEEPETLSGLILLHFATAPKREEAVKTTLAEIASSKIKYKKEEGKPFKGLINGRKATGMDWQGTNSSTGATELISHRVVELEGGDVAVFIYIRDQTSEPRLAEDYGKILKSMKSLRPTGKKLKPASKKPE